MKDTTLEVIENAISKKRSFFSTQQTKNIEFRLKQLRKFKAAIKKHETQILEALWLDLHKSNEEAYLTELSIVIQEIDNHISHLSAWTKQKKVATPFHLLPSSSKIIYEPLGIALIVAPWNYPFQLLMNPLVGAITAGCCALLKPSPNTPNIAKVMEDIISHTFNDDYISLVQGGRQVNENLFKQRFDIIFFTGSPTVGKVVMRAASEHLCPVVLELGGKSPCIVDKDANIDIAAKRIAWGKTINAGQTCIAPDYLFVHQDIKDELVKKIATNFKLMFGENPQQSKFFPRIVSDQAMQRLSLLLKEGNIVSGGIVDFEDKYISPTIIDGILPEHAIMKEEIFGPILPVLTFSDVDEALDYVNKNEKPLAFYYFGKSKNAKEVLSRTTSGGACINDTLMHITNHNMPFGGVGNSGLGNYHGYDSFLAFSHQRAVVCTPTWIDLPFKYVPFKYFKWLKKII